MSGVVLSGACALTSTGAASAHEAESRGEHRSRPKLERLRERCVREIERRGAHAVTKLRDRVTDAVWLTDDHATALTERIDAFASALAAATEAAQNATTKDELRAACDRHGLERHFKLVRLQIRGVGAADAVDADLADLQVQLDDVAAELFAAEVVDADLLVAEVQALLDNIDVAGVADSLLALVPEDDDSTIADAAVAAKSTIETAHAELEGVLIALDELIALIGDGAV